MTRTILHLDMDAFFAAVEQLDHPEYKGKPVVVGADPRGGHGRGVVATASYEARKFGIHSAMPISQAYRRCPQAIYLRGNYKRYAEISRQVIEILTSYSPQIEKISIDEAFLDVTQSLNLLGNGVKIAQSIKNQIRTDIGLTASVGVAPNKFLAKIASDLDKPDGLVMVEPGQEQEFLRDLPISKLWGVGKKTEAALAKMSIRRIGQIAELSEIMLNRKFGKWGNALWRLSQGLDDRPVVTGSMQKSISQERTFEEDVEDEDVLQETIFRLAESLSRIIRSEHLKGRTITLKLRLEDFSTYSRSKTVADFIDSPMIIRGIALELYQKIDKKGMKVRLIGIGLSQLNSVSGEQLGLFDQEAPINDRFTKLLDAMQNKYGEQTIKRASLLPKNKSSNS